MPKSVWAECPSCLHRETLDRPGPACPACGGEWLDAVYDYESLAGHWRERIAARGCLTATALAPPFLVLLASGGATQPFEALGALVLSSAAAAFLSSYVWGRLSDRSSRKVLIAVGLFLRAGPMIATLFQSEVFTASDVMMSRRSLMAYSLGLVSFILIKVLAPGYYARQDTRTPVRIAVIAMASNMVLNIILVFPLAHAGLALATSLSASLNAFLLFRGLRLAGVYRPQSGWWLLILRGVGACVLMGLLLYWAPADIDTWFRMGTWERVWWLLFWIVAGAVSYFIALFSFGIRLRHFRGSRA